MWPQKSYFIPSNVVLWLQDIRKTFEDDVDGQLQNIAKSDEFQTANSSSDSVYDNVDFSPEKDKLYTKMSPNLLECGYQTTAPSVENDFSKKNISNKAIYPTWPLGKCPKKHRGFSLSDLTSYGFWENGMNAGVCIKDHNHWLIRFNSSSSKLSVIKRDITYGKRDLGESLTQEEEPNLRASVSNLLASHREKHTQECSWTWLNAEEVILYGIAKDDLLRGILNNTEDDRTGFEESETISLEKRDNGQKIKLDNIGSYKYKDSVYKYCHKALPSDFVRCSGLNVNNLLNSEFVIEKPPVPPKRRKRKMNQKHSSAVQSRKLRKVHLAKVKSVSIPTVKLITKDLPAQKIKNELCPDYIFQSAANYQNEFSNKEAQKPLPFSAYDPELECEISELLMMQRVTKSSKERRRISSEFKAFPTSDESNDIFQGWTKNIPEAPQLVLSSQLSSEPSKETIMLEQVLSNLPADDSVDAESQEKVKQFLQSRKKKLQHETKPKLPINLREDIIIDWENDYKNLNEPILLEGKSVVVRKSFDVHLRPKEQLSIINDCQSSGISISKDCSDDETYEETTECCDTNALSTDEISNSSQLSSSITMCEENAQDPRNSCKLLKGNSGFEITEIVTRCDKILSESNPKCDTEPSDKISFSSVSDGLNSYSDFESDVNETIALGEIWYGEKFTEENASVISWNVSEDTSWGSDRRLNDNREGNSDSSKQWKLPPARFGDKFEAMSANIVSEVNLETITEDQGKVKERKTSFRPEEDRGTSKKLRAKSSSEANLDNSVQSSRLLGKVLSKSLDFFRDSWAESRLKLKFTLEKHDSITSDIYEWMSEIRGIAFAEDQLFSDDDEWILSFDSEERAYFFEETSKKSLWTLPDYSRENAKPEFNYPIQRSATENTINSESSAKLRLNKHGSQARITASTRSSKAQSMLIEPKLDVSPKNESKTFSMPRDLSKIYGEIIQVGVLNKTKICENGKKLRKNWTPSFILLTDSYLFFFKDAKSFQNMKNVIGSNGNHMCLSLQGAVIEKGEKISSRKNVYKISCSDNTDVLIQTDKTSDAEKWFKEISSVIEKLPRSPTPRGSPLLDSKSSSKVGRTKSLKVKSKETGSMEDLSSTPEERQNKIKARLKKFFNRRPTVDSLKKKGIWKDEPVFGCSLEQITKNRNPRVPVFVEKCIECIESKEENMKTDGLYRASGNLSQVQKIRLEVDQNNLNIMKEEEDVHVLTGSLKLFFRELKEPLIPSKQLEPALLATDKLTRKERIRDFQKIVKSLPSHNYDTLKFLLQHLLRVKEYHRFNRMNINNLAIVFGPTLMWPEQESANMALELMQQNVVIECLLKEFEEIFT